MSEQEPERNKAQEILQKLSEDDLKAFLEAEITEEAISEELTHRLGERGLTFTYLLSDEGLEVWIKPEDRP